MTRVPSDYIISTVDSGDAFTTRRTEIYEADGVTRWFADDDDTARLVDGSVGVDYGRDERRSIELTLDNEDNALRPDPDSGLWYDKVIKSFSGLRYPMDRQPPKIAIVEADSDATANAFRDVLLRLGFTRTDNVRTITSYDDVSKYDIIVSYKSTATTKWASVFVPAINDGKAVAVIGPSTNAAAPDLYGTTTGSGTTATFVPYGNDNPFISPTWTGDVAGAPADANTVTLTGNNFAFPWAKKLDGSIMGTYRNYETGARAVGFRSISTTTQGKIVLDNIFTWLWNYSTWTEWEVQTGEFCIDQITEDWRPHLTKITGRDYTKRCLTSKFEQTVAFDPATQLDVFVKSLAANAGITKFRLPSTPTLLIGSSMTFDRTTERWAAMRAACEANNYELYFDQYGYLTMREYLDPTTSPISSTFQTGEAGNLVTWARSTNDSRLYNHIIVTGDSGEEGSLPFFGEARNEEPSSPTRISRIGDRSYFYTSSFFTSNQQCEDLALRWLKEKALESYELSWTSVKYPWMEVGEIVEFLDPRRTDIEPTKFLMDSLSIPLGLGPMSATGKRVTFVNDPGLG